MGEAPIRAIVAAVLGTVAMLVAAAPASAGTCSGAKASKTRTVTAPVTGWLDARLDGSGGDWDLTVLDRGSGRQVAGGSGFGADEVAQGLVTKGQRLSVQACRLTGRGRSELSVDFQGLGAAKPEKATLVHVSTPTRERKNDLQALGLDLTEHGRKHFVAVVLHGADDAAVLRKKGFAYTVQVPDLARQEARDEKATASFARNVRASALPSGRKTYRVLSDYTDDMKRLVRENPGLVRPFTLRHKTWEGRTVEGIEITTNVDNVADGKPIFMNMGIHHAREWPSGEHAMEWAFELVNGYKRGDARTRRIVSQVRTVIVPVVNPDGFNISRTAGSTAQDGRGRPNPGEDNETVNIVSHPYEYRRKNCRVPGSTAAGSCLQPAFGLAALGVDPNRNYGTFWGGPGASSDPSAEDHFGPGPFSEPETQNIKEFMSARHVTVMITNHTFSDLILRPPGLASQGNPPDEKQLKALGDSMAQENGYFSQHGFDLYDTTGTTEDWSYNSTGGFGYTFEIGCEDPDFENEDCLESHFHPPYQKVVDEYEGNTPMSKRFKGEAGGGNREAYYKASLAALDTAQHSLLAGRGPHGIVLRLKKEFQTPTSADQNGDGKIDAFKDVLDTTYEIPGSDNVSWHINPSTRPLVEAHHRPVRGPHSPAVRTEGNPPPTAQCPNWHEETEAEHDPNCWRDHPFEIPGGSFDNAFAVVTASWTTPASDYLIEVYRDVNGNGKSDPAAGDKRVADQDSAVGISTSESTTVGPDPAPGKYVLRVANFTAVEPYDTEVAFQSPPPFVPGVKENWNMSCETFGGKVLSRTAVRVDRGQRTGAGLAACAAAVRRAFRSCRGADRPTGKVRGRLLDRARLGRDRRRHLRSYKLGRRGRRNVDRFCLSDRRLVSIGYPTARATRGFGRAYKRRIKNKAILILTSSRRFKVRGLRAGTRLKSRGVRRRLGSRRFRVGRNTWYLRRGSRARLVYKVRRGRITAVGIADKRLTSSNRRAKRFLRSFL